MLLASRQSCLGIIPFQIRRLSSANGKKYNELVLGVPKEIHEGNSAIHFSLSNCHLSGETRVALTPASAAQLVQKGLKIRVESNAGVLASFQNHEYEKAGAEIVSQQQVLENDILFKIRPPKLHEVERIQPNATLISFIQPTQNADLIKMLEKKHITALGMELIPRVSRAQVFGSSYTLKCLLTLSIALDALSSMANIAGYKAVVEAANHFGRFFGGQITAAGRIPPAKVLIIGAGVSGLSAIGTAKNLGAIVRAFDTRPATKEQILSLGGEYLEVKIAESGEGVGGYAKEMSPEFLKAEHELFEKQCKDVDIIITTALIPNKKAPVLITKVRRSAHAPNISIVTSSLQDMVALMKRGSVIVDLAAEAGGNVETTRPNELYVNDNGVTHIGFTNLPARLPTQSSTLYSNNITKFFLSLGDGKETFLLDLKDEVVRGSIVTQDGKLLWPPPPPPAAVSKKPEVTQPKVELLPEPNPFQDTLRSAMGYSAGIFNDSTQIDNYRDLLDIRCWNNCRSRCCISKSFLQPHCHCVCAFQYCGISYRLGRHTGSSFSFDECDQRSLWIDSSWSSLSHGRSIYADNLRSNTGLGSLFPFFRKHWRGIRHHQKNAGHVQTTN